MRHHACFRVITLLATLIILQAPAPGSAIASTCQSPYLDYSPCTIEGAAITGTKTTSPLFFTIFNFDIQSHTWLMVPTSPGDPSCSVPNPAGRWSSFVPFSGQVPAFTTTDVNLTAGLDATLLAPGTYREYGCFEFDVNGAEPVPIPINFTVFPIACSTPYADHSPCEISVALAPEASGSTGLFLTLLNFSAQSYNWTLAPSGAGDTDCSEAGTGVHFSSFTPFTGAVPAASNVNVLVDVNVNASALPIGTYEELACLLIDAAGVDPVAIPIHLIVADIIFSDSLEQPIISP